MCMEDKEQAKGQDIIQHGQRRGSVYMSLSVCIHRCVDMLAGVKVHRHHVHGEKIKLPFCHVYAEGSSLPSMFMEILLLLCQNDLVFKLLFSMH